MQLLRVQVQPDLKLKDDENDSKCCVLQNQAQQTKINVKSLEVEVKLRLTLSEKAC